MEMLLVGSISLNGFVFSGICYLENFQAAIAVGEFMLDPQMLFERMGVYECPMAYNTSVDVRLLFRDMLLKGLEQGLVII